jgi:two-component system, NtrC family, response regulator AtoC
MTEMQGSSVLVVDDDVAVGTVLVALLEQAGISAQHAGTGEAAMRALARRPHDLVITDVRMPGMDGMQLLAGVVGRWPEIPVIVLTAHGTIPLAVDAIRAGAADFLLKPFDRDEIIFVVQKRLQAARSAAERGCAGTPSLQTVPSRSPAMRETLELLARAAGSTATVLIRGESGVGKELAARAIHDRSPRRDGPFVTIQCAALPESLLESELFGYEKGAFTGAACRKPGRIELAHGGTLFLDEIGDVALQTQVKLLRVLQERTFERLGGTASVKVDVRFVAATHRDLDAMLTAKTFREDLFYRLSVIPVMIPPLRDRPEDIAPLAMRFSEAFGVNNGKGRVVIEQEALDRLQREPWPGNVRQLQNFVERLVVLAAGSIIGPADVERELARSAAIAAAGSGRSSSHPPPTSSEGATQSTLDERRRCAEREALREALDRVQGNRTLAARILGVSRRTLYNMLALHSLD